MNFTETADFMRATSHMFGPVNSGGPLFKRTFAGAAMGRLQSDWDSPQTSADAEHMGVVKTLRGRSRELERSNEITEAYLGLIERKVLGAKGVQVEIKAKDPSGTLDTLANETIKKGWLDWGKRDTCVMAGNMCWREVEGMALRRAAADGGLLVREIFGAPNPYRYSLDVMEIDQLDVDYNTLLADGGQIRFGVEMNDWGRVLAYHLWTRHPGDTGTLPIAMRQRKRIRVSADELIHIFWMYRPKQTIGVPWLSVVLQALEHLGKYSEAEMVASRISACKGYAIEQQAPSDYTGPTDGADNREEMQPGMSLLLDPGQKMVALDPTHPNSNFGAFTKDKQRGIAAGLGVSYNSLTGDLEAVNYSSMRAGKLDEQEEYMAIQEWLIESLHARVFKNWLGYALMAGALKMPNGAALPVAKFDKFHAPDWKPRRWPWVDPQKDITAAVFAMNNRLRSRRSIIAEMGGDIATVDQEQEEDGDLDFLAKPVQGGIAPEESQSKPDAEDAD